MDVLEEEQIVGDILAVEEEMSNNEVTGTSKIQLFKHLLKALQYANALNLIEKELDDMATTTFYLDEEEMNQGLPEELESSKGQKGI